VCVERGVNFYVIVCDEIRVLLWFFVCGSKCVVL